MIGIYFLAYVGSKSVIDLPLNLVAPDTVRAIKMRPSEAVAAPMTTLVIAANYSSGSLDLTYSITT